MIKEEILFLRVWKFHLYIKYTVSSSKNYEVPQEKKYINRKLLMNEYCKVWSEIKKKTTKNESETIEPSFPHPSKKTILPFTATIWITNRR